MCLHEWKQVSFILSVAQKTIMMLNGVSVTKYTAITKLNASGFVSLLWSHFHISGTGTDFKLISLISKSKDPSSKSQGFVD